MHKIVAITAVLVCSSAGAVLAQQTRLDYKIHDVGKIRQVVTNVGTLWTGPTNYPGLIFAEYPPNSFIEHLDEGGIKIGAIVGDDTLVSITNWNNGHQGYEFYPGAEASDSIWVVQKGDTKDIPWWPGYVGISDQDFVARYDDYTIQDIFDHNPLYVDVTQVSYAWASPPLDEVIVYRYFIVPTRHDLAGVYVAFQLQGQISRGTGTSREAVYDDRSIIMPAEDLAIIVDTPGGRDGFVDSPIGLKAFPPEGYARKTMQWYTHHHEVPMTDVVTYEDQLASGEIMQNQQVSGQTIVSVAYGPFDLQVGDTLEFSVAEVMGRDLDAVISNATRLETVLEQDFKVPSAPPPPPLHVDAGNQQVALSWNPQPGEPNPEDFFDPYRGDQLERPFEGYRIYKSTWSQTGPWTLLAEFDREGNGIGFDTGVQYEYIDTGLLNNFEYFYTITAYAQDDEVLDFTQLESSANTNAIRVVPGTEAPQTVGQVAVVPNPYRGDAGYQSYNPRWEKPSGSRERWMEQDRRIQFINLPARCEILIYTVSGDLVQTLRHESATEGYEDWNLTSSVGQAISSGIYLFTVEDLETGETQVGKFVIIK
jgi:hypothetical protein